MNPGPRSLSGGIVLLSTYELGHQPIQLAWPLAALRQAGLPADAYDLSVQSFPQESLRNAAFVAISVPMHTALRLGIEAARRLRDLNPRAHINFYGLYAWLNRGHLLETIADSVIAGDSEDSLVDLIRRLDSGRSLGDIPALALPAFTNLPRWKRPSLPVPLRRPLPSLREYAHYSSPSAHTPAGYTETTRGCKHTCAHCPITPVYNGRFYAIPAEDVLADIRQQVAAGAGHITFGDPDFLNGPGHALKIARLLHAEFPHLSFDFTAKVEHIVKQSSLFPELSGLGCTFVTSAFESTRDPILARLEKGHTLADMHAALEILGQAGIAVQPTWMPFTPWTSLDDYLHMLAWMRTNHLVPSTPAVQLSIRMLVPPGSALLGHPDTASWLGELDPTRLSYRWRHPDPRMDDLHRQVAALVEHAAPGDSRSAFQAVEDLARRTAGMEPRQYLPLPRELPQTPRLSENWFC